MHGDDYMRNSFYYAARAAGRAAVREQTRVRQANERAAKRQQKEEYLNHRLKQTDDLNNKINNSIGNYVDACGSILNYNEILNFEEYKKEYEPKPFSFRPEPSFVNNADRIIIPTESWLEKIFKSKKEKRINCEIQKAKQIDRDKDNYQEALLRYNEDLIKAKKNYNIEEEKRKREIESHNNSIDLWEKNYYLGDTEAVNNYLNEIISDIGSYPDVLLVKNYELEYIPKEKKIVLEITLNDFNELFIYSGYKYVKSRDSIEPLLMNKKDIKKYIDLLFSSVAAAYLKLLFNNDTANLVDCIKLDIKDSFQNLSINSITKKEFKKYNTGNQIELQAFTDKFIEVCEAIKTI